MKIVKVDSDMIERWNRFLALGRGSTKGLDFEELDDIYLEVGNDFFVTFILFNGSKDSPCYFQIVTYDQSGLETLLTEEIYDKVDKEYSIVFNGEKFDFKVE